MSWKDDIERELALARGAVREGNHGKARTCARRAVGIAATALQTHNDAYRLGPDFIRQIRTIAHDDRFSEEARGAADRLGARLSENFTSPSGAPVDDATLLVDEILRKMEDDQARSSER